MHFNLQQIRAFIAVAEELHFNAAAQRLHVGQPALSRTIRALEEAVGTPLLERTTRSVALTPAGQAMLESCLLSMQHLQDGLAAAHNARDGQLGTLRIAYMDFAINGALPATIKRFSESFPRARIDLIHMPTEIQKEALLNRAIDFAFMVGPFVAGNISSALFQREDIAVVLCASNPLARHRKLALRQLADQRFIMGQKATWESFRPFFFQLCHRAGFAPAIAQEASTSDGILGLVAANMGITLYPRRAANLGRTSIAVRPLADDDASLDTIVCWRTDRPSPLRQAFLDAVLGPSSASCSGAEPSV
jgi:DNA-binding transcriptional LysR family regulator